MRFSFVAPLSAVLAAVPVLGWGDEGHEITGTIAQIHLFPSTQRAVCDILPPEFKCNLANVATWADKVKRNPKWKWSSELHYVNPKGEHPPTNCLFGEQGWVDPKHNILPEIVNNTRHLQGSKETKDIAIRFLTHYLGDLHQPFHLTARGLGGNNVPVFYQGEVKKLHGVWDGDLIRTRIRTLENYTDPLPTDSDSLLAPSRLAWNQRIEAALQGSEYDPLVRWIVSEGVLGWWVDEVESWVDCGQTSLRDSTGQQVLSGEPFEDPSDLPVCPYHWSEPTHRLLCDVPLWLPGFIPTDEKKNARAEIEIETPQYAGHIRDMKLIEKQLALGGLRLAAVLNAVFGSEKDRQASGSLPKLS